MDEAVKKSAKDLTIPVGAGGVWGHIGRMIIMVLTAGYVFPNAFVEGLNLTECDNKSRTKAESGKK